MHAQANRALFVRALRDHASSAGKIVSGLAFYAFLGSWVYSGFADNVDGMLEDFPDELTALMGGGLVGATGGYVTSVMMNMLGPLVFIGLAVSWGANAIAGEEASQTARLLFAQPVTRRQVMANRALGIAVAIGAAVAVFGASLGVASALFSDSPPTASNIVASCILLAAFAISIGMIALAAGSATGSRAVGVAAGAAVGFASYLVDSFAPLTRAAGLEKLSPWYLYNGNTPIDNGLDIAHLLIQLTIAVAFFLVGASMVTRRDLETGTSSAFSRFPELVNTRQRVDGVFARTLSVRLSGAILAGVGLAAMATLMGALFTSIGESLADLELPESLESALGGSSLGSPVGWMNSQVLTIVAPLVVLGLAISSGAKAIAGERDDRTIHLVLAAGLARSSFFLSKVAVIIATTVVIVVFLLVGLVLGSAVGSLELSTAGVVGVIVQLGALGIFFGVVAASAGTLVNSRMAVSLAGGLALASFLSHALLSAVSGLPRWMMKLSPWEYYMGNNPLDEGVSLSYVAVLLGLSAIAAALGLFAFDRADAA